jgi:hypothetical protein
LRKNWVARGYGCVGTAWRTVRGIEAIDMLRKGRMRWLAKDDSVGQARFIGELFGITGQIVRSTTSLLRFPTFRNGTQIANTKVHEYLVRLEGSLDLWLSQWYRKMTPGNANAEVNPR